MVQAQEFKLSAESEELKKSIITLLDEREKADNSKKYVVVQFYINRIFKINDVEEAVALDFYLKLNWKSERWIGKTDDEFQEAEDRFDPATWWEPGVEVTNGIQLDKQIEREEAFWLEYGDLGILAYTQRFNGTISAPMKLHNFPFDSQRFSIQFESFHWKAEDCELLRLPNYAYQTVPDLKNGNRWLTMSSDVRMSEWDVKWVAVQERQVHYDFEDRNYSQVFVSVSMKRKSAYYVMKLMLILLMIVIMGFVTFVIDPNSLSDRCSIIVTLFLSAVAFNFVGSSSIPKVGYLTQFDLYMLACYGILVFLVIETLASYLYFRINGAANNFYGIFNTIDLVSVFLFPIMTVLAHILYVFQVIGRMKYLNWKEDQKFVKMGYNSTVGKRGQSSVNPADVSKTRSLDP